MSYEYYLHKVHQLMAMGLYNPTDFIRQFMPSPQILPMIQTPYSQVMPLARRESTIVIDSESDEENDEDERSLFCANLDEKVTEELLYELFLQAGPIEKVRIPKDNNGRQRTFGFIIYKYRCTPPYALQLYRGVALFRKTLDIKFQGNPKSLQICNTQSNINRDNIHGNNAMGKGK